MPRRNLQLLLAAALLSVLCYQKVQSNRYSESLVRVFDVIERRYLEPVEGAALFTGAVKGMVGCLDANSTYFPETVFQEFMQGLGQEFGGVGLEIGLDEQTKELTVISPLFGTPAYEAGVMAGDRIASIDGRSTQGLSLEDCSHLLRGPPGARVVLGVLRGEAKKAEEIALVRAVIQVDSVLGDTRNPDGSWNYFLPGHDRVAYLRITTFGDRTAEEVKAAMQKLRAAGLRGLVIDVRNNSGGRLDAAVAICDMFIDAGVIVTTRIRGGQIRNTYQAHPKTVAKEFPMAVLVNRHSASASEIVAACLQDHGRAAIVGERTYGKGTVQEVLQWEAGQGALKLTTASYWRPSNRNINKPKDAAENADWGVSPDPGCLVAVEGEELVRWARWRAQRSGRKPGESEAERAAAKSAPLADAPLLRALDGLQRRAAQ